MRVNAILTEMLEVLKAQAEAVATNNPEELMAGTRRHEELLTVLEQEEPDEDLAELKALYEEVKQEKKKLQSLLLSESVRVDFLLRLILGGPRQPARYHGGGLRHEADALVLNRRA